MIQAWQQRNTREKLIISGALLIIVGLCYFLFVIEPLSKKTTQLQQQANALQSQLPEIKQMVANIQNQGNYDYNTALDKIKSLSQKNNGNSTNGSRNGNGGTIYMTSPLPEAEAKQLFQALYTHGKTQLISKDNGVMVWHHAK